MARGERGVRPVSGLCQARLRGSDQSMGGADLALGAVPPWVPSGLATFFQVASVLGWCGPGRESGVDKHRTNREPYDESF